MQTRLQTELERRLGELGIDYEFNPEYANTGTYYLFGFNSLEPCEQFRVNFQQGYWSCKGLSNQPSTGAASGCYIDFSDSGSFLLSFELLLRETMEID